MFAQFWKLKVWDQGTNMFGFWILIRALFLACRWLPSLCVLVWRGEKDQVLWCFFLWGHWFHHEGPTLLTSSKHKYLSKAPSSNTTTLWVRFSTHEFSGRHISVHSIWTLNLGAPYLGILLSWSKEHLAHCHWIPDAQFWLVFGCQHLVPQHLNPNWHICFLSLPRTAHF